MVTNSKITASILGALLLVGVSQAQGMKLLNLESDNTILAGAANIILIYFVLALLIERACEVLMDILTASGAVLPKNDTDQRATQSDRRVISMFICLVFAVVISMAGLRLVESILELASNSSIEPKGYFPTFDALLTTFILAGGSDGIHQVMRSILGEKSPLASEQ